MTFIKFLVFILLSQVGHQYLRALLSFSVSQIEFVNISFQRDLIDFREKASLIKFGKVCNYNHLCEVHSIYFI